MHDQSVTSDSQNDLKARSHGPRHDQASWERGRLDALANRPSRVPPGADALSYLNGRVEGEADRVARRRSRSGGTR